LIIGPGESQGKSLHIMSKIVLIVSADAFAAAQTIEELKALGAQAIVLIEQGKSDLNKLQSELDTQAKALKDLTVLLEQEKLAHAATKELSAGLITDLKDQLSVANANIDSELPVISHKGKKLIVAYRRFHLPKDNNQYTLEDLRKGKASEALIGRILSIKGQTLLTEATA
jgi:hypothetical protein